MGAELDTGRLLQRDIKGRERDEERRNLAHHICISVISI